MWELMNWSDALAAIGEQNAVKVILDTNLQSKPYGLVLSEQDAGEIIQSRNYVLKSLGRVELGIDVISKLICTFCNSPYINQPDYTAIINELVEGFYYIKNETLDQIDDDELMAIMKDYFDNRCYGSIDLLLNRELYNLARYVKEDYVR